MNATNPNHDFDTAYDLELSAMREICNRVCGWDNARWNYESRTACCIVRSAGFASPAEVRRVANRLGKRSFAR